VVIVNFNKGEPSMKFKATIAPSAAAAFATPIAIREVTRSETDV
jgi:hypothetical protein